MGKFFNRMYYGDPRKPDLKLEDMPDNRFELFFTVLKVRFWKLIQLNLMYSIFWIPTILWTYMQGLVMAHTDVEAVLGLDYFLILIPCLVIAGPATAGVTYVIRNWAKDEHAWIFSDFKDAWKENWKESLLIMLINGVALMLFYTALFVYTQLAVADSKWYLIPRYFILMMGIIFAMMNMFIFPMLVTYKLKIKQIYKNALIFTIVELPRTIFIFVISMAIFYLSIRFYVLPMFIIGFTLPMLISISYANWVFDKYLNKNIEGAKSDEDIVLDDDNKLGQDINSESRENNINGNKDDIDDQIN
ncbi:MAG TPA: DUF624 domain-containing protein [Clostridiales bacterium]|nr:DUF624 domain-containing protein [Clostridiales bacterium]